MILNKKKSKIGENLRINGIPIEILKNVENQGIICLIILFNEIYRTKVA